MFRTIPKFFAALALILTVALPTLLLAKAVYDRQQGKIWLIDIAGYDPRDLLRGHYLNFTYDWNYADDETLSSYTTQCLCLTETAPGQNSNPVAKIMDCQAPEIKQCGSKLISRGHRSTIAGAQVYFIPEEEGPRLEHLLRGDAHGFQMEIAVPRSGGPAIIRDLYINQQKLGDFLIKEPLVRP